MESFGSCPIPISDYPTITLAHGGGGLLMHQLIEKVIVPAFAFADIETEEHDGFVFDSPGKRLAFTSDSFVVNPLFFPGGDIGKVAVCGTVNDLAMCGARPLYLSCGFILEEGLPMEDFWKIVQSMALTAKAAGVRLVTGDTKVVDKGKGDGLFVNTSGVGVVETDLKVLPSSIRSGDALVLSGDLGRHGIIIMSQREGLSFETPVASDCAPLNAPVQVLLDAGLELHCLRDLTRGGLASTLVELSQATGLHLQVEESKIPVLDPVRGACEILGFDPLYVANEGRFLAVLPADQAEEAVNILLKFEDCPCACVVGNVLDNRKGQATLKSTFGAERIIDMLSGEQLPRIC